MYSTSVSTPFVYSGSEKEESEFSLLATSSRAAASELVRQLQLWPSLTRPTDGAAVVGFEGGVHTVGGGAVGDAAVHFPVGLAATALTPGHLRRRTDGVTDAWMNGLGCIV